VSLSTQALDCIHNIRLLGQERVPQIRGPLNVARHPLNHVWKLHQSLDAWVPRLLGHCVRQCLALQIFVLIHPLLKLNDFEWISGSSERLSQE